MCIRDRSRRLRREERVEDPGDGLVVHPGAIVAHLEDDVGTVSYTHLRAHETVLDLVCRLLLEKKKTHKQNPTDDT